MKWGFDNPNDAAACWLLVLLTLPMPFARKPGIALRAISIFATLAIFVLVLTTASRGAMVALVAAAVIRLGYAAMRRFRKPQGKTTGSRSGAFPIRSLALLSAALLGGALVLTPLGSRLQEGISGSDPSVQIRTAILGDLPEMMVSAPAGWGSGKAAHAWQNWFEPVGGSENLRHLLSSHATWLVEWPWTGRIAYLFGWAAIIALALPGHDSAHADALAYFVAAFVLGLCNHVFLHPLVLALFLIGGLIVLGRQWFVRNGRRLALRRSATAGVRCARRLSGAALFTLIVTLSFAVTGRTAASPLPIRLESGSIFAGDPTRPAVLVPWIDEAVFGKKVGHAARNYLSESQEVGCLVVNVNRSVEPPRERRIPTASRWGKIDIAWIVAGGQPVGPGNGEALFESHLDRFPGAGTRPLVWLNPPDLPAEEITALFEALESAAPPLTCIGWGEWRRDARPSSWRAAVAASSRPAQFSVLRGIATYVGNPFSRAEALLEQSEPAFPTESTAKPNIP